MQYRNCGSRSSGKERDSETGLNYFGARYYCGNVGRFTSTDPVFFQAQMLSNPQRFNLYAYALNNPLKFVDPTGEAVELNEQQLKLLKNAVGKKAADYLYLNPVKQKDGSTRYFLGILKNGPSGKGASFEKLNSVAADIAAAANKSEILKLVTVEPGFTLNNGAVRIGQMDAKSGLSPAVTVHGKEGNPSTIYAMDPDISPGDIPGDLMSDGEPSPAKSEEVMGHEIGHFVAGRSGTESNRKAIEFEKHIRQLRDPAAPTRERH